GCAVLLARPSLPKVVFGAIDLSACSVSIAYLAGDAISADLYRSGVFLTVRSVPILSNVRDEAVTKFEHAHPAQLEAAHTRRMGKGPHPFSDHSVVVLRDHAVLNPNVIERLILSLDRVDPSRSPVDFVLG